MKKLIIALSIATLSLLPAGCKKAIVAPAHVVPLYTSLADYKDMSAHQRDSLWNTDSVEIKAFMQVIGCDTVTDSVLTAWSSSRVVEAFTPEVLKVYPDVDALEQTIGRLLNNAAEHDFRLPQRNYAAVVWGFKTPIVFNDSTMLIALNHYLGKDFEGYNGWAEYQRLERTPERLPYDLIEALIATQYPYEKTDSSTVLSRIVYEGALTMAKVKLVAEGSLQGALGYTDQQLQWLNSHQGELWQTLVSRKLLFSTSDDVINRLVNPSPSTSLLSPYAPGRAGRYIGYCILVSYLQNNTVDSLPSLLSPSFYNNPSLLIESAYGG